MTLKLITIKRTHDDILKNMSNHYSQPKGFVGRNICYKITYNDVFYGCIVGGSSTKFLPGRNEYFNKELGASWWHLENIVNNIFFHIEPVNGKYPIRNFAQKVLTQFKDQIKKDWCYKYQNHVFGYETLIELPRTGEIYLRNGWVKIGVTKGYTCKREGGLGTDSWSGKRVWNTTNLRPKLVLVTT